MIGNKCWPANARVNVNPTDDAYRHQLLHPPTVTATVVAPSVVYHYHVLVALYGHRCPAMIDAHREYLSVLRLALFLVSRRAHQYFEGNLKMSSI
jgi:hypothetical protein